jgi:hypothetical protein
MSVNIDALSVEDLIELNKQVVTRIKELQSQAEINAASQFRIGDIVSFTAKDDKKIVGFITAIQKYKVKVFTEENQTWTLPASILVPKAKPSKKLLSLLE